MSHLVKYKVRSINFNQDIQGILKIPDDVFYEKDLEKRESEILQIIESELIQAEIKILEIE